MQVIEKNSLFAQVSGEQSAVISGGTAIDGAYVLGAILASSQPDNNGIVLTAANALVVLAVTLAN
ncbi:MAG: hypothetical protein IV298_11755 [Cylindrospermopsis raciborskii KL1]|uniref:hypothetical protein n=1 Tax=Cylindrospermopsis raciborskii TaxID=77022 RepID=UPI001A206DA2|nr:hypothetical protein [Cylindrospermopsis raciborskii]MBG0744141.1 hypothetical protein [Cylindrospermopsis raciborskii KL1]